MPQIDLRGRMFLALFDDAVALPGWRSAPLFSLMTVRFMAETRIPLSHGRVKLDMHVFLAGACIVCFPLIAQYHVWVSLIVLLYTVFVKTNILRKNIHFYLPTILHVTLPHPPPSFLSVDL